MLLAGDGVATNEVARRCGTTDTSVRAWRRRFVEQGVEGVGRIAPGRGRRSWLPAGTVAAVVDDTLQNKPDDGSTHWTTRLMARRHGIGKDTVARIWRDHGLKPWKVDTFKISNDPKTRLLFAPAPLAKGPGCSRSASIANNTSVSRASLVPNGSESAGAVELPDAIAAGPVGLVSADRSRRDGGSRGRPRPGLVGPAEIPGRDRSRVA